MIENKDTYIHPQRHPSRPNAAPSLRPRCAPAAHSAPALRAQMLRAARWVLLWLPCTSAPKATPYYPRHLPAALSVGRAPLLACARRSRPSALTHAAAQCSNNTKKNRFRGFFCARTGLSFAPCKFR